MSMGQRFRIFLKYLFVISSSYCIAYSIANSSTLKVSGIVSDNLSNSVSSAKVLFINGKNDTTQTLTDSKGYYELFIQKPSLVSDYTNHPVVISLCQNYPNPFNPSTIIEYSLTVPSHVRLNIYNCFGQLVRKLVNAERSYGKHSVVWNGRDEHGRHLAAGIYLYRIEAEGRSLTRKMLLLDGGRGAGTELGNSIFVAKASKNTDSEETALTIVIIKEGYESYNEETVIIPLNVDEFNKDIVIHKKLPDWITDNEMKELIRRTFVMAVIDGIISDAIWAKDKTSILSRKNIDSLWLPSIPEIPLILQTPLEIQAIADSTQDYMYFRMPYAPEFSDSFVVISLNYVWAVGKNSHNEYLSGGGFKVKFTRNNDKWDYLVFDHWIS
jgi:hypothetical protein